MIRRLRALAPTILLTITAGIVGMTALAQAAKSDYVTTGEMHRFVVATFLGGVCVILAGVAWVYSETQRARERRIDTAQAAATKQITELAAQVVELVGIVRRHHEDWTAHPTSHEGRIDRMEDGLQKLLDGQGVLREEFSGLRREHELIRDTELCIMRTGPNKRDPKDSPFPRREDDPTDKDYTDKRGKGR